MAFDFRDMAEMERRFGLGAAGGKLAVWLTSASPHC